MACYIIPESNIDHKQKFRNINDLSFTTSNITPLWSYKRPRVSKVTSETGFGNEKFDDRYPFIQQTAAPHPGFIISRGDLFYLLQQFTKSESDHIEWYQMEDFIQYELNRPNNKLLDSESINESRWEVFRECFDIFITEFTTYKVEWHTHTLSLSLIIMDAISSVICRSIHYFHPTLLSRYCFKSRTNTKRS